MTLYVLLNIIIIAAPAALSFDKRVAYVKRWPRVFLTIFIVGGIYIFWDVFAAARGDWSFNSRYSGAVKLFGLPLGELLFFFTVPFSCIFIYEVVRGYFKEREVAFPLWLSYLLAAGSIAGAVIFRGRPYTFTVLLVFAGFLILGEILRLFRSFQFWFFLGLSMVAFIIFNSILTSLPIVSYGKEAILNIRAGTIPIEDFFYNISLLGYGAIVFNLLEKPFSKKRRTEK